MANTKRRVYDAVMDEGRKRVILIAAAISRVTEVVTVRRREEGACHSLRDFRRGAMGRVDHEGNRRQVGFVLVVAPK